MKFQISDEPEREAAKHLADLINNRSLQDKVLLLLAGGSAEQVYNIVPEFLLDKRLPNLMVIMGDEWWARDPNHKDSDLVMFKGTKLFSYFQKREVKLVNILDGDSHENDAIKFDAFLRQAIESDYYIIAMLGIGADGHTAGIIPVERSVFNKTFLTDSLSVSHSLDEVHTKRITITPQMIKELDEVFVFTKGKKKKRVLQEIAKYSKAYPSEV